MGRPAGRRDPAVATVLRLRRRPIGTLGVEDLRCWRRSGSGSPWSCRSRLAILERDPLAEGDLYPGDLLSALVRRVPGEYWRAHPDQAARLRAVDVDNSGDGELAGEISAFRAAGY